MTPEGPASAWAGVAALLLALLMLAAPAGAQTTSGELLEPESLG